MQSAQPEEHEWLQLLRQDDEKGMQLIFDRYYKYLVVTACNVLGDDHKARDLVQDVFFEFWKKRETLELTTSLKAYLRRAVVNRSISEIRKRKRVELSDSPGEEGTIQREASALQELEAEDLQRVINRAIDTLPAGCRRVFALSRFENLSHKEIAAKLDISVKTIENQITKALKVLRVATQRYGVKAIVGGLLVWIEYFLGKGG